MSVNIFTCRDVQGKAGIVAKIDRTALEKSLKSVRDWKSKFDLLFGSCEERGRWIYVPIECYVHDTVYNPNMARQRILKIDDITESQTFRIDDKFIPEFYAFGFGGRFPEYDEDLYLKKEYPQLKTIYRKVRVLTIRIRDGIDEGNIISRKPSRKS